MWPTTKPNARTKYSNGHACSRVSPRPGPQPVDELDPMLRLLTSLSSQQQRAVGWCRGTRISAEPHVVAGTPPLATSRPPPSVRAHDRVHVAPRTLRSRPAACARTPATRNADDRSGQGQPSPFPCVRPAGRPTMRRVPTHVTCILLGSGLRQSCLFLRAVVSYYDGWMDGSREHLGLGRSGPAPTPLRIRSQQWMPHLCVSSATTVKRRGKGKPKQKRCHRNEGWRPTCRP